MPTEYHIARRDARPVGMSIGDLLSAFPLEGGSMALYACEDWKEHLLSPIHKFDDRAVASFHSLPSMHALTGLCSDVVSYGILVVMRGEDPSAIAQAAEELPRVLRTRNVPFHRIMYHWMEQNAKEAVRMLWKVGKVSLSQRPKRDSLRD
ncbi:hypothetical protein PENSPDRAFT_653893 [Peniophora sp. CONT]|nr:hypothetical protein PENSPDRAFT_653893 [Peniophora sp. CONT]